MNAVASRVSQRTVSVSRPAAPLRVSSLRVVCKASSENKASKAIKHIATVAATLPALIVSHPAFALVDERLNGDGTGRALGVNDPALGWTLFGVFSLVWALWYNGQKDLGDFDDKDAGLKL